MLVTQGRAEKRTGGFLGVKNAPPPACPEHPPGENFLNKAACFGLEGGDSQPRGGTKRRGHAGSHLCVDFGGSNVFLRIYPRWDVGFWIGGGLLYPLRPGAWDPKIHLQGKSGIVGRNQDRTLAPQGRYTWEALRF